MKDKMIILKGSLNSTDTSFIGPFSFRPVAKPTISNVSVDVKDLDRSSVSNLSHNAEVLAFAPAMPIKLITPFTEKNSPKKKIPDVAWGVKAVGADTSPYSGEGVIVAVLDTGIDASHPAFKGIEIIEKDFTGEGNGDRNGHGTHCAGTIFGRANGNGPRIGVAPGVHKALIGKVLSQDGGSSESIVRAIQWALENGANIISMSLGIDFPGQVDILKKQGLPLAAAASRALEGYRANVQLFERLASLVKSLGSFSQATILVGAAGNESDRPNYEIAVSPPAVSDGFISVAALGQDASGLTVARFSNTFANISGPGVEILSAKIGGGYSMLSGTSMATPHVAGVAALWAEKLKKEGYLTSSSLTARILGSANTQVLKHGFERMDVGEGLVQAPQE